VRPRKQLHRAQQQHLQKRSSTQLRQDWHADLPPPSDTIDEDNILCPVKIIPALTLSYCNARFASLGDLIEQVTARPDKKGPWSHVTCPLLCGRGFDAVDFEKLAPKSRANDVLLKALDILSARRNREEVADPAEPVKATGSAKRVRVRGS
jgi:hypothetical protein